MEHAIPVALPDVQHPDLTVNTEAQVNVHARGWEAFRDAIAWLVTLNKGEPRVGTSGPAVWVTVKHKQGTHAVDYVVFAPHSEPSLDVSRVEYVELALADALLRP